MSKLKWCTYACIWSLLLTGCSALWTSEPLLIDAESTKVYVEKSEEEPKQSVTEDNVQNAEGASEEMEQPVGVEEGAELPGVADKDAEPLAAVGESTEGADAPLNPGSVVGQEGTETIMVPEETEQNSYAYFDDALFIGDSRTVGLREYGLFENSDFFATPGLSIYAVPRTKVTVHDMEDVTLEELLTQKDYGKIYLMLGMNELGYDFEQTVERYRAFVEDLQTKEPQAKLYLCANMHVTIVRTENDDTFNNPNIDKMNEEIRKLAEEKELPYLDINVLFDDENGNLNEEYTSDDSHVLGKYYEDWCEWLTENISE